MNDDFERIIEALRTTKMTCPSLRVGQMIGNVVPPAYKDPYYIPDRTLADLLEAFNRKRQEVEEAPK